MFSAGRAGSPYPNTPNILVSLLLKSYNEAMFMIFCVVNIVYLSLPIHPGKHVWWYWNAGHRSLSVIVDISLWEGVMVLK